MVLPNNKTYDVLKFIAQVVLPAIGALYFGLSEIWGFPYGVEVVGSIACIDAFLGALLGLSTAAYNRSDARFDGTFNVVEHEEGNNVTMEFDDQDPYILDQKDEVLFKVRRTSDLSESRY